MQIVLYYKDLHKGVTIIDRVWTFKLRDYLTVDYQSGDSFKRYSVARGELDAFEVRL